jgi:glycosyltransferase involved in cell wall biosynthesis
MKQHPLVSVIVPTKNSSEFLEACLKSIKNQTFKDIEIIVVDNHSTDKTPAIAKRYADKFYTKGPERSAQRNYGVKKSAGDYVAIIDSDMELTERVIESCIDALGDGAKTRAIIIPEESFGKGFWAQCKKLERSFYVGVDWIEAARFFDKNLYFELKGYNENLVSGEDWDLSQRAATQTKVSHADSFIMHNEGNLKLWHLLKKKYYYAQMLSNYLRTNKGVAAVHYQTGPVTRYKLFFMHPAKLFRHPLHGAGMLFMKTLEFGCGAIGLIRGCRAT